MTSCRHEWSILAAAGDEATHLPGGLGTRPAPSAQIGRNRPETTVIRCRSTRPSLGRDPSVFMAFRGIAAVSFMLYTEGVADSSPTGSLHPALIPHDQP